MAHRLISYFRLLRLRVSSDGLFWSLLIGVAIGVLILIADIMISL